MKDIKNIYVSPANARAEGKQKILIVEPKAETARLYARNLAAWGFEVSIVDDHLQALSQIEDDLFDAVLVSMESLQLDGSEFCWLVRRREENRRQEYTGLILICDRNQLDEIGDHSRAFDDILVEPFSFSELRWRVVKCCALVPHLTQLQNFLDQSVLKNVFEVNQITSVLEKAIKESIRLRNEFSFLFIDLYGSALAEIGYGASTFAKFEQQVLSYLSGTLRSLDRTGKIGKGRFCVLAFHLAAPGLQGLRDRLKGDLNNYLVENFAYLGIDLKFSGVTVGLELDPRTVQLEKPIQWLADWVVQWGDGQSEFQGLQQAILSNSELKFC